jgi:hypothetical protein
MPCQMAHQPETILNNMERKTRPAVVIFILILALGLTLRLFQIGSEGFWIDELGVAKAAYASTIPEVLSIVRSHVMAMPLDYIMVWGMGHFSTGEGWLRLPEVLWGTLTLLAAYILYRDQISPRAALWGIFLLALSPALIKYSQELRFYAPLVFFYTLSTAIGLKTARKNTVGLWLAYTLVTIVGVFFHLYVALSFVNVAIFFITRSSEQKRSLIPITASFMMIFGSAVIAVAQFGKSAGEPSALFAFESPLQVIGAGLGFLPPFNAPPSAFIFGVILLCLALFGLWHLRKLMPLAFALLIQIAVILGLAEWRGYFASARQLLPLLALVTLFAAGGVDTVIDLIGQQKRFSVQKQLPAIAVGLLLATASLLVLVPYYKAEKTSTRFILEILKTNWQPGQQIWVAPSYNLDVYSYYGPWLAADLRPFELSAPEKAFEKASFLIADPNFDAGLGFIKIYKSPATTFYPKDLWRRP